MIGSRSTRLLPALWLAAACAGHRPLPTLEPVPGSRTREAGEIVPLDSSARRTASTTRAEPVREIHPLGETAAPERAPLRRMEPSTQPEASAEREIRRLGDANEPTTERMIVPLGGRNVPSGMHEVEPLASDLVALDSTRWVGSNSEGSITFEFLVGGILRYSTANGVFTNGTWQQTGTAVTFEFNSRYAEYSGQIRGARMSGTWHNRAGVHANWEATRQ